MILQLDEAIEVDIQLSPNDGVELIQELRSYGFQAIHLSNLQAYTRYEYTISTKDQSIQGSFRTFPEEGQKGSYTFVTGSCQETENRKVFDAIPKHEPLFMMHTGDWAYPDVRIGRDYAAKYETVALSYTYKYNEDKMKEMLLSIPMNYAYDDHDHVNNGSGRFYSNDHTFKKTGLFKIENKLYARRFPFFWHTNVVKGYMEFFPHYEMADTAEAIHHSFKMGNAEFFVIDRSSAVRDSLWVMFEQDEKGKWSFHPKPEHKLFGDIQMAWLKEGLKNSTADWKFIVSGVPLNKSIIKLIKAGFGLQNFAAKGYCAFKLASGFANYWAAYPYEMNDFHAFLEKENIKDVIVISGDSHHNVMDDGKNAGLPELNASGLSVEEIKHPKYLRKIGSYTFRYRYKRGVWNQGGNGLGNKNFKNAFGKVLIEGDDFVELSIIDEDNELISSFRVPHSSKVVD